MTPRHTARVALATAAAFAALAGPAAAQTVNPPPGSGPQPGLPTIVEPCSLIASITPASARPGQDVDIRITPPSGRPFFFPYSVTAVHFANNVPAASWVNVAAHHVRARVPVGTSTGPVRVTCRSTLLPVTWSISSATAFTPVSFGNTLNPSPTTILVGNSRNITATLSHPAPSAITLNLNPQSTALSVQNNAAGAPGTATILAGAQSATFSVRAHAAGAPTVEVSGPNVSPATLTVNVPTPGFTLDVPNNDAEVHWGDSASYTVEVESINNYAGPVNLTATGLPFGASPVPVSVNVPAGGSATATFSVATAQAATALGSDAFTLRGQIPNTNTSQTRPLNVRVLPDEGAFTALNWNTGGSSCNGVVATVAGNSISFHGPTFTHTDPHSLERYAWTDGCRGAVVLGTASGMGVNDVQPASIFNFGFDNAIAAGPGSRYNLGVFAWHHEHFHESPDGSFVIGASRTTAYHSHLYNMLDLAEQGGVDHYGVAETLDADVVGNHVHAVPVPIMGNPNPPSDPWDWALP
jgi:hypothetical protein